LSAKRAPSFEGPPAPENRKRRERKKPRANRSMVHMTPFPCGIAAVLTVLGTLGGALVPVLQPLPTHREDDVSERFQCAGELPAGLFEGPIGCRRVVADTADQIADPCCDAHSLKRRPMHARIRYEVADLGDVTFGLLRGSKLCPTELSAPEVDNVPDALTKIDNGPDVLAKMLVSMTSIESDELAVTDIHTKRMQIAIQKSTFALTEHGEGSALVFLHGRNCLHEHRLRFVGGAEGGSMLCKRCWRNHNNCSYRRSDHEHTDNGPFCAGCDARGSCHDLCPPF